MLDRWRPNFLRLTQLEAAHVVDQAVRRGLLPPWPTEPEPTGERLYNVASDHALCHADVCAPLLPLSDHRSYQCLEKLVGKPITRLPPASVREAMVARMVATARSTVRRDPRVIVSMVPNPKRPHSESWARYNLYKVGMTVDEYYAAGGLSADIRWDTKQGFITLEGRRRT